MKYGENMTYTFDELIEKFSHQAIEFVEKKKELEEKYPGLKTNDFNLPLALYTICQEIKGMK